MHDIVRAAPETSAAAYPHELIKVVNAFVALNEGNVERLIAVGALVAGAVQHGYRQGDDNGFEVGYEIGLRQGKIIGRRKGRGLSGIPKPRGRPRKLA
jgi:hypothetical protein